MIAVEKLAKLVLGGDIVVFPCDTLWGLVGLFEVDVWARIHELKRRPESKPFVVLVPGLGVLEGLVSGVNPVQRRLMSDFWPGPLTIVFDAHADVRMKFGVGTIALRYPKFEVLNRLLDLVGRPLISTSVNLAGEPAATSVSGVSASIRRGVDHVFEGADPLYHRPSTLVKVVDGEVVLLREGVLGSEKFV